MEFKGGWTALFLAITFGHVFTVSTECPATVHPDVKGFGPDCRYRCNCVNNTQCDDRTGDCPSGCLLGWMGPGCQYRNYATTPTTDVSQYYSAVPESDRASNAIDGDVTTCSRTGPGTEQQSTQLWWRAEFQTDLYIVGLLIKISSEDIGMFRGFYIEIGNTTSGYEICYQHGNETDGESVMDVNCIQPMVGNVVRILLADGMVGPLSLCEVEIYGGRLVSFNKPTSIPIVIEWPSGSFWNASYAVDGRQMLANEDQDVESERTCAASGDYRGPQTIQPWDVQLGSVFNIQGISFFGRINTLTDQYRSYIVLTAKNNSTEYKTIFADTPQYNVSYYNPKSKNYTTPILGSIIRVERLASWILIICEFEVFGECPIGGCGWECSNLCMCSSQTTGINKIEGTCPYGCSGRWTGLDGKCNIECSKTEWGPYCNNTCGQCKDYSPCRANDGICPDSCRPGWIPPYCLQECVDGYFGEDCNSTCGNCINDAACDKENGICVSGCEPGYKHSHCREECDAGTYGNNCSESCGNCRHGEVCDHVTGICQSGCQAGYKGISCKQPCNVGWYGFNCMNKCGSCKDQEACNATSGYCPRECSAGWLTEFCNMPCGNGLYGDQCKEKCGICLNDLPCNHEDGSCTGCAAGYHGNECKTECDEGSYGENCESVCGNCAGNHHCNRTSGTCPFGCESGFEGSICSVKVDSGFPTKAVIGAVFGVLAAVVATIIVVVVCKRRSKRHGKSKSPNGSAKFTEFSSKREEPIQETEIVPPIGQYAVYYNYTEEQTAEKTTIKMCDLRAYSHGAVAEPSILYAEFEGLPYGLTDDASAARDIKNKSKNRYKDMYPYDKNRVILPEIEGQPNSTYINASYINGYDGSRKYIAAQAALETTVDDIWRMVWSEKISVIVMLTKCVELGTLKCVPYWSEEDSMVYGDICTDITSVDEYTDFTIRTFQCTQIDTGEKRTVYQFHYTAWPDKDVPNAALSFVQFWRKVRGHVKANCLPWMIHCSAGAGRTGTFIALDYLYDQGKSENEVNIKEGVLTLRQQRLNLVQTKHQYIYLHEAITEALDPIGAICGTEEFHRVYRALFTRNGTPTQALRHEFDTLCTETGLPETGEGVYSNEVAAGRPNVDGYIQDNREKSRNLNIVPDDAHRPRLGMAVHGRNDFINAVYIPVVETHPYKRISCNTCLDALEATVTTYRQNDRLILTQFPLPGTTVDFVRMVWEFDIDTVVLLDDLVPGEGVYWPSKDVPKIISPFTAEHVEERKGKHYTLRIVRYTCSKDTGSKEVRIFHFRSWNFTSKTPADTKSMLKLICDIENEMKDDTPFVVQCIDGAEKSGLFCVLCCLLERMKTDREVAIAETVRLVKLRRTQAINNFEQYVYCYRIIRDYLDTHEVYANVM